MSNSYRKGSNVSWNWGSGTATGKVEERFDRRVQRTLKGAKVVKNGTADNPAYLIEQDDGMKVLKRGSELSSA
ncbi:DUF2945 domain-containing protein [Sphingomonas sp. AX6]|uniref:DUF2945 domain-containing protein n=1 Tax=Sphingomonas sp. AX6 TaxID=2653171 RepID=UPI0012F2D559|nr:DUF2945 domain-containing protein [Sphingomonas sp. AX6]VXC86372.1 conserved hypothetical protein [Sphingomonas sp. AX6]